MGSSGPRPLHGHRRGGRILAEVVRRFDQPRTPRFLPKWSRLARHCVDFSDAAAAALILFEEKLGGNHGGVGRRGTCRPPVTLRSLAR